jgi:hypothetical protein
MPLDPVKQQRIRALEELLEIEYEKLSDFQKVLAITSSVPEKFDLKQRLKREVLPDIRKHEIEYAELLADTTELASVPAQEAEVVEAELVHAVQRVESLPDPSRPEEITRLLTDIRGWRRLRSLESAVSRRDQGRSLGISSQPSAEGAFGRSQTLKNNVRASPPVNV